LSRASLPLAAEGLEGGEEGEYTGLGQTDAERLEAVEQLHPGVWPWAGTEGRLTLHQGLEAVKQGELRAEPAGGVRVICMAAGCGAELPATCEGNQVL
jgi:hypothetical protein